MSKKFRNRLYTIIFEADTPAGKLFDVVLLIVILLSLVVIMLESVKNIDENYGDVLNAIEWVISSAFLIEFVARVYSAKKRWSYLISFFGIIDILSILPFFVSLIFSGAAFLVSFRVLRLVRVFRIFKLARYVGQGNVLVAALKASKPKILVFLLAVLGVVFITGTLMYLIEGEEHGFTSIPRSIYWTIVTLTTVGYGDIAPQTILGQSLASVIMIVGYAIIAVPTGIVSSEISEASRVNLTNEKCPVCQSRTKNRTTNFCSNCGTSFKEEKP